jgi:hypothetical protein
MSRKILWGDVPYFDGQRLRDVGDVEVADFGPEAVFLLVEDDRLRHQLRARVQMLELRRMA